MRKSRGYSLIEVILVVALMAVVAGVGLVNTNRATSRGEASGVAELLAEELRSAQSRAMSQHIPVGLCFPAGACCQGFYVLEGAEHPRVTRSVNYAREFPGSRIFLGLWPVTSPVAHGDIQCCSPGQEFTVNNWGTPQPSDYTILFTPSGVVKTNGLPYFDSQYHLVVAEGVTATPSGTSVTGSPLAFFQLTSAGQPSTICLTASGAVHVEAGVTGEAGGLAVNHSVGGGTTAAPLGYTAPGSNHNPVVTLARLDPEQTPPFQIQKGQQVSVVVEASDPDGDPLYLSWTTSPSGLGKFSSANASRMTWVPSTTGPGHYRATWVWTAPETGIAAGQTISLNYQVSDTRSGTATGDIGGDLVVTAGSRLAFTRVTAYGDQEIATSLPDGSKLTFATIEGDDIDHHNPAFNPDATKLANYGEDWNLASLEQLYVSNVDGTGLRMLMETDDGFEYNYAKRSPSWSSDGTEIAVADFFGSISRVNVAAATVATLTTPATADDWDEAVQCSPLPIAGADRVLFVRNHVDRSLICTINLNGGGLNVLSNNAVDAYAMEPTWSKDGSKVVYTDDMSNLWVAASDGSTRSAILTGVDCYKPQFSPDGTLIAFINDSDELCVVKVNGSNPDTAVANSAKAVVTGDYVEDFWWSPNNNELVWSNSTELFTVNALGAVVTRNLPRPEDTEDNTPVWEAN